MSLMCQYQAQQWQKQLFCIWYFWLHFSDCNVLGKKHVALVCRLVIGRWLVPIPSSPSLMPKCPWARYWTPNCSWWAVGTLHDSLCLQCIGECDKCCKWFCAVSRLEKRYRNASPFTITYLALLCVHFLSSKHLVFMMLPWMYKGCLQPKAECFCFIIVFSNWL